VPEIVVKDRTVTRVLAVFPALATALAVRLLTLDAPPLWLRMSATVLIGFAAWLAYRLLTAQLTVGEDGVQVRGVFYDAHVPWTDLDDVTVTSSGWALRMLLWGILEPQALVLTAGSRTLRPIAALSRADDDDIERALGSIRVRAGARG
jgi:hypothetical protein